MVAAIRQPMNKAAKVTLLGCLLLLLLPTAQATVDLDAYPGAEVVKSSIDPQVTSRRIYLGSLKKINNVLAPESLEFVSGSRNSTTYYIPAERRVDKVVEFYRRQLSKLAQILFECRSRDCGSSNYWANTVFQTPILYGPEQYQSYLVGLTLDQSNYISIYIGQRGTRKIYVHIETTTVATQTTTDNEVAISAALNSRGRYVIALTEDSRTLDSIVEAVAESMNKNLQLRLTLVAHDDLRTGETVEQSRLRTLSLSESVRSALVSAGIAEDRLSAYGVGPLSPFENRDVPWLELLVLP